MTRTAAWAHEVRLLEGGRAYFSALVDAIDSAHTGVQLETYIFDVRGQAQAVAHALLRAAQRGVQVCVVVDGVGTGRLPAPWPERLAAAGVQWRVYAPLGAWGLLRPSRWRRMHRKLAVIDGRMAFCGGINVLDDCVDLHHGALSAPRLDFALGMRGPLVPDVAAAMADVWAKSVPLAPQPHPSQPQMTRMAQMKQARHWRAFRLPHWGAAWQRLGRWPLPLAQPVWVAKAALLLRDSVTRRAHIERAYLKAIATAKHEIVIANAYFLPGRRLRKALVLAALRGVRVRLLLQGRYEYFISHHASRAVYGVLLAAGVQIHEYTPSFLHAKVAVVDPEGARPWATVGSSNLDPLSLLLAKEANVVVADGAFARQLHARLVHIMDTQSTPVRASSTAQRSRHQRVLDTLALVAMRVALWAMGHRY